MINRVRGGYGHNQMGGTGIIKKGGTGTRRGGTRIRDEVLGGTTYLNSEASIIAFPAFPAFSAFSAFFSNP